ncbi:MAG: heme exporter protein CcmD [Alphaproteobacteria bacterium]
MDQTQAAAEAAGGYFAMDGYAAYIWPAYGIAAVAIVGLVLWSVLRTRALERRAASLRREGRARR